MGRSMVVRSPGATSVPLMEKDVAFTSAFATGPRFSNLCVLFYKLNDHASDVLTGCLLDALEARGGIHLHDDRTVVGTQDVHAGDIQPHGARGAHGSGAFLWCDPDQRRYASPVEIGAEIKNLKDRPTSAGLRTFFEALMNLELERKDRVLREVLQSVDGRPEEDPLRKSILLLYREYPSDIGVLAPLYLNLVTLEPGEAMYLPAGQLHAYLKGCGMELMANSDNVLRGGLTPKHVDVPELLKTLIFEGSEVEILYPESVRNGETTYITPAPEFVLSNISVKADRPYSSESNRSIEIIFCQDGAPVIKSSESGETLTLEPGTSVMVAAALEKYSLEGEGVLYKAGVPV